MKIRSDSGFTLVELLLAMAFFSFILLFVTTGFIMINRSYNKGLTVKLVQDEARRVTEELTREIRTTAAEAIRTNPSCLELDGTSYYWSEPISGAAGAHRLLRADNVSCSAIIPPNGEDVLNEKVGVQYMNISQLSGDTYSMKIVLSTATDLVASSGEFAKCSTISNESQYCDIVTMTTVVTAR